MKFFKKPKICLLFCGGTIAMGRDKETGLLVPSKSVEDLLAVAPELNDRFDIAYKHITSIDSSNIQPSHWTILIKSIEKHYNKFDGFVILHGTDTMAYTASALALGLQGLTKTVAVTGSMIPAEFENSDAKTNLINAFRVASLPFNEVVISFGNKILRGIKAQKWSEKDFNAFYSLVPPVGIIKRKIKWSKKINISQKLKVKPYFEEGILQIRLHPGFNSEIMLDAVKNKKCKGIILQGFGSGNVPTTHNSILPLIEYAIKKRKIPVLLSTQCIFGKVKAPLYGAGYYAHQLGAILTQDLTYEAALVKLSWCLAQTKDIGKIRDMIKFNYVGEIQA
tara:strand:- start:12350 stop:13357 length:1008 start_codon:yes stop_codon:yes gene_type:complete